MVNWKYSKAIFNACRTGGCGVRDMRGYYTTSVIRAWIQQTLPVARTKVHKWELFIVPEATHFGLFARRGTVSALVAAFTEPMSIAVMNIALDVFGAL